MNELDLHGFTHDEAVLETENWVLLQSDNHMFECRVIVSNTSQKTKKKTKKIQEHRFRYYIPSWNVGEIIISN